LVILEERKTQSFGPIELELEPIEGPVLDEQHQPVDREFSVVHVNDAETGLPLQSASDVLDDAGDLYSIDWCPD
jgi:hypothetical protein